MAYYHKRALFIVFVLCFPGSFVCSEFPFVQQCFASTDRSRCVFVDPTNGSDSSACLSSNSPNVSCQSLDYVFNAPRSDHTVYVLGSGVHNLTSPTATFQSLNSITIIGVGIQSTIIQCMVDNTGLSFEGITDLNLSSLSFHNCSALRNSTSRNYTEATGLRFMQIQVALYFYSCDNLTLHNINVSHSPSAIGVVVYDTIGTNTITSSVFSHNTAPTNSECGGGGGFYVEFTFCIPGNETCSDDIVTHTNQNHDSIYTFENCLFESNVALSSKSSNATYLVPLRSNHNALGRGGGLSIFMKANASRNTIIVKDSHFGNNSATWGGGLFVEFHDNTSNNTVIVSNTTLTLNHCPFTPTSGTGGGGMRLGHYVFNGSAATVSNRIVITNCTFTNNTALNGGGLSISPTVQSVGQNQVASVLINESIFNYNIARLGAALHVSRFAMILDGNIISVLLSDCKFEGNSNDYVKYLHEKEGYKTKAYQPGLGAVYVNQVPLIFRSQSYPGNVFTKNNGSALAAIGASLDFSDCTARFFYNEGMNGGAIALLGLAWLRINDETSLVFVRNLATIDGGAIYNKYIERENLITYVNCFIRHTKYYSIRPEQWKATFEFHNNRDQSGARLSAIYSTSILPCAWGGGGLVNVEFLSHVFCWNDYWSYYPNNSCIANVHSDIGNVAFTGPSHTNTVEAFPGRLFKIPVHISDDLHVSMGNQTVFSSSLNGYQNSSNSTVKYIWNLNTEVKVPEHTRPKLLLDSIGDRVWHVSVHVKLLECPPGFSYNNVTNECWCLNGNYSGAVFCDSDFRNAYLGSDTWMGKLDESNEDYGDYLVAICPPHYCFSEQKALPNSTDELNSRICGTNNRNGTMCGSCIDGHAVAVNSPSYACVNCSDDEIVINRLVYIVSVYIPLALLFSLIILFNIRLTSAPANAFILYCQLLASTFDLNADGQIPVSKFAGNNSETFVRAYKIIYGIFNLEFIEQFLDPFCVGDLNALEVIALDYAVAFFPLVMILVIMLLYRLKRCFRCIQCSMPTWFKKRTSRIQPRRSSISEAILPAFAAFFLLSYNKFSTTSSFLVGSQPLLLPNGKPPLGNSSLRVYFDGTYSFYDPYYRRNYLIPASIVFATFVAIPPILLLDFPIKVFEVCLIKVPFLWRLYPVDKVHILLDTFQGCFKNKMRFFAGAYFLFRLAVNTSYNLTNDWFTQFLIQEILCLVMVALLVVCQPYSKENKLFNFIDPLIFLNLGILNVISYHLLAVTRMKMSPNEMFFILQCVLVLLPLVFMILYIVGYLMKPCLKHSKLRLKETLQRRRAQYQALGGLASTENSTPQQTEQVSDSESDSAAATEDEALLRRAEKKNTYRPQTRTVVEIDGMEGEAITRQTVQSTDSGLRSVQTTSSANYGSTENSTHS